MYANLKFSVEYVLYSLV